MSIEKAKEFLIELSENDDAMTWVDQAYVQALVAAAGAMDYEVSDEDVTEALAQMSGLGEETDAPDEDVSGMGRRSRRMTSRFYTIRDSVSFLRPVMNLGFRPPRFTRRKR